MRERGDRERERKGERETVSNLYQDVNTVIIKASTNETMKESGAKDSLVPLGITRPLGRDWIPFYCTIKNPLSGPRYG